MQFSLAKAVDSLESFPASNGDVLTAEVGQQISLTCSHENVATSTTAWRISPPVDCDTAILHGFITSVPDCGPFSFHNVTQSSPFNSTAVTIASASMTGAVVQCRSGVGTASGQVGRNITLCIIGEHMYNFYYISVEWSAYLVHIVVYYSNSFTFL